MNIEGTSNRQDAKAPDRPSQITCKVRLLATTDLHMHLTAHNFVTDKETHNPGLAGIATLVDQARAEASGQQMGCALFDNGDLLQGTAMGDWLALHPVTVDHPAIACLHALGYDAIGVGNHDLDYGVPYLRAVAGLLAIPVVASNLAASDIAPVTSAALVPCAIPATDQHPARTLQIGVLSVLPQQTAMWNHHLLEGIATVTPAQDTLRSAVPALRASGAELVIVLAHMGLDQDSESDDTVLSIAQIPGIDAIVAGHTHRRFPGHDHANSDGLNTSKGTVEEVPAIMPGHAGSDLAVLDLDIKAESNGGWRVTHHDSQLRSNTADTCAAPAVLAATAEAHKALRRHLAETIGVSTLEIHNYFSLAEPTSVCAFSARAKEHLIRHSLEGRPDTDLPIVVAIASHTAGGRDGPQNFLHIPKGPLLRRHLAGLDPYSNQIWAIRITGAELKARLEHAASIFTQLEPDARDQPLHNPIVPAFNFDTFFGLEYAIDPTRPVGQRIKDMCHDGAEVLPNQRFLLVTNQFRAAGGGGYAALPKHRFVARSPHRLQQGLLNEFISPDRAALDTKPWRFSPSQPVTATLFTSPDARHHLSEIAHLSPQMDALTDDGFAPLRLTF